METNRIDDSLEESEQQSYLIAPETSRVIETLQYAQERHANSTIFDHTCKNLKASSEETTKVGLLAIIAACLLIIVLQNFFVSHCARANSIWVDDEYLSVSGSVNVKKNVPIWMQNEIPVEMSNIVHVEVHKVCSVNAMRVKNNRCIYKRAREGRGRLHRFTLEVYVEYVNVKKWQMPQYYLV